MEENNFKAARKAADMTIEQAANIVGLAACTYPMREKSPGWFRLDELKKLGESMNEVARPILKKAIGDFLGF